MKQKNNYLYIKHQNKIFKYNYQLRKKDFNLNRKSLKSHIQNYNQFIRH